MKTKIFFIGVMLLLVTGTAMAQTIATPTKLVAAAEHYEGGLEAMYKFINENITYPPTAKRNRIKGECVIHVKIMEDGSVQEMSVVKNIGGGCGAEALRVAKLLKFKAPGFIFETSIPFRFKL